MEHRQLMNFLAVCEEKNFTRAAEKRHITQQGLSWSIRELEAEIGAELFDRSRRGAKLTEYGEVLESAASAYTNQHEHILETLRTMKEKSGSRLSIGIATDSPLPPRFLPGFISAHPGITLSVKTFPLDLCQRHLLEQRLQVGISFPPIDTDVFDAIPIHKTKVFLVAGKDHALAKKRSLKMRELRNENVIAFTTAMQPNPAILELCRRNGIVPETQLVSLDYGLVAELCSTGRYVGFGARIIESLKDLVEIEIEDAEIYAELHLIINRRAFINPAAKTFIAWAKEWKG